ncbi:NAD-dependent epimerase/dehydratase family protein [Nonomuraea basaltis]|uniref:NAD-dependent epimerase/dehydratase family protein n=1 Tax=Nonomuraea basaltis TaxID=2495887 RepID=UPI00110C68FA|nr:NAD-dependent epimerase/dehydratase family protein [Nonomuraea basaltis]
MQHHPTYPRSIHSRMVVTGAAGFIGSHLADALLAAGNTVIGVDRRSPQADVDAMGNLAGALRHPSFTFVAADLRTCPLEALFVHADVVFHLAAQPGVRASWGEQFADYSSCNVFATERVLTACENVRVPRLVFASSSSVYGTTDGTPITEDALPAPESPYAVSKLAAEHLCLSHAGKPDSRLSAVALRLFTVYGPRQRPDMLIGRALAASLGGPQLDLYGDGTQRRDFTYVGDVVHALIAAATTPITSTVLNVGAGASVSVLDVLAAIEASTGQPVPVTKQPAQAGDVQATLADRSKAADLLGWTPSTALAEGISRQHASFAVPAQPIGA